MVFSGGESAHLTVFRVAVFGRTELGALAMREDQEESKWLWAVVCDDGIEKSHGQVTSDSQLA